MRHRKKKYQKLGRTAAHRKAMLANLASSLILNECIVTTLAKAKACKAFVDKVISTGKDKSLNIRRRVRSLLRSRLASDKVIDVLVDRFRDREGGFSALVRIGRRKGDNAQMAKIVLIGSKPVREIKKVKLAKKKKRFKDRGKKAKEKVVKRKSVLDRVKELRSKFLKKGVKKERKGQTDAAQRRVEARSRSGI